MSNLKRTQKIIDSIKDEDHLFTIRDCKGVWFYVFKGQEEGKTITIAFAFENQQESEKAKTIIGLIKPGILSEAEAKFFLDDNYREKQ